MLGSNDLDNHILNIIRNMDVYEQADLQQYLAKRGFTIPQATLSRRLKKLNVAKVSGVYEIISTHQPQLPAILSMKESDFGMLILAGDLGAMILG